jgi:cytochrome c2
MPATESTWRNQPLLHRIFAISGVILTLTTIWMFYADHERSWKDYQVKTLHVDQAMNVMRQEEVESSAAYAEHEKYDAELQRASAAAIPAAPFKEFLQQLEGYAKKQRRTISTRRLTTSWENVNQQAEQARIAEQAAADPAQAAAARPGDADAQQAARKTASEARRSAEQARDRRARLLAELRGYANQARIDEEKALNYRKVRNGEMDAAKADVDLAIRDGLSPAEIAGRQKIVDDLIGNPDPANPTGWHKLNQDYQVLGTYRREMEKALKQITAEEDVARKKAEDARADLVRLQTAHVEKRETWAQGDRYPLLGKKWLTLPILDAFGTPRKIDNLWSKDLEQDYNFSKVRRFDRCTTCHQSLAKLLPGEVASPAYEKGREIELVIAPPAKEELPKPQLDDQGNPKPPTLEELLGIRLASEGLLDVDDVTVKYVRPKSPAASARLVSDLDEAKNVLGEQIRLATARYHAPPDIEQNFFPTQPGLVLGDVIVAINGSPVVGELRSPRRVGAMLTLMATQSKPIQVTVRRGFPHPFTSHPRLDLYVSDASPHKMGTFACTICHDGQGSATDFEWASHTPNTTEDAREWMRNYGWFDNPHWIYPMYPKRFAESACLKCHHEVVELEPSQRFPDAPAPKVTHGYHLVRKYGCYGCHEVNGFDGPLKRVGPDLRLEPNYFAVAQELVRNLDLDNREAEFQKLLDEQLDAKVGEKTTRELQQELQTAAGRRLEAEEKKKQRTMAMPPAGEQEVQALDQTIAEATQIETTVTVALKEVLPKLKAIEAHLEQLAQSRQLAFRLTHHPEDTAARNELRSLLAEDQANTQGEFGQTFTSREHRLANMLKDIETPGALRKAGPSLRFVGDKLDPAFLYDWIENPKHFRPSTRMPRFFGLWDHLRDEHGKLAANEVAPQLEPVEIRGVIAYLADYDQPLRLSEQERQQFKPAVAAGDVERGKTQFEIRGCLACHTHKDFPDTATFRSPEDIVQGPDLSAIASKFDARRNPAGPVWLYAWIKEPTRYHARTVMPNLFLEREKAADGSETDPAADIAAYLLSDASASDWKPIAEATQGVDLSHLRDLTLQHLKELFFEEQAKEYLDNGIPPSMEAELKGAEVELVQRPGVELTRQQLRYIGRKTIAKYGCFGCHDIPGFEDAKPIGTGLADWGRKDPARLAFEHITHYLEHHGGAQGHGAPAGEAHAKAAPENAVDVEYYLHQVQASSRIGFIYQKLTEPRSYDFKKTTNKRYNERLRMPQFPFSLQDREAIITFVLGLVAEPPREKYLYRPDERQRAIIQGKQVLEKYNCGGCHVLEAEKWKIRYSPGSFGPQDVTETFPFLLPHFGPEELAKAGEPDRGAKLDSELRVLPSLNAQDGLPVVLDESDGTELDNTLDYPPSAVKYFMDLYRPALLDGQPYLTGQKAIQISVRDMVSRYPTTGGLLTRYLLPRVTALEKQANPQAKGSEAWGWLPPPLLNEGKKVQPQWLHDFLLEPYPIRPAVFLRMPRFNMTSQEATALVNYFSAVDNADHPFEFAPSRQEPRLAAKEAAYRARPDVQATAGDRQRAGSWRFEDAMKIVVNKNYCTQCHKVGDYVPQGSVRAMAPNLADVYRRLRPEYARHWIANPAMILPYTPMPVNVKYVGSAPHKGGIAQDLYHGTSLEQVDALVDLLMNYDQFARENTSIKALVPATAPAATGAAGPTN